MIKCNFACFLNSHEQLLEIGLGDVIYTGKTSPEFSVLVLGKDLMSFKRYVHFINLLFNSDESIWGKKKGKVKQHRLGGRFSPICFRVYDFVSLDGGQMLSD